MYKMSNFWSFLLSLLIASDLPRNILSSDDHEEILGCGGFIRSQYKLDFDKIEIKLFTKQGSLRMKTECAPTGYYFIPLEAKGDYILRVSPPEGWTFEPSEYEIHFDGKTDVCSKGMDINFDFKGFSIYGSVVTKGYKVGPSDIALSLAGPSDLKLGTKTGRDGSFNFESIPPGVYSLRVEEDPRIVFGKRDVSFEIQNKNLHVENEIAVLGYQVWGSVQSEGKPVEGVYIFLYSHDSAGTIPKDCETKLDGLELPPSVQGKFLCHQRSDSAGSYSYKGLLPGKYSVLALYRGKNIIYNMNPEQIHFELLHQPLQIPETFEVEGFTVQGRVKGLPGASILVNGKVLATSGHDGLFSLNRMKGGTYEFEILAEKFQFDKQQITINPSNPTLPIFTPSRFLTCGHIKVKESKSPISPLNIAFSRAEPSKDAFVHREKVIDPSNLCVFLPEGKYEVWVEAEKGILKYFIPEKLKIHVPGNTFNFQEFTGSIGGSIQCVNCENIKIRVTRKSDELTFDQTLASSEKEFTFEGLESGEYRVQILNEKYCWEKGIYDDVQLKSANINSLKFVQTGYSVELETSHGTSVQIRAKSRVDQAGKSSKMDWDDQKLNLEANSPKKICLPQGEYTVMPSGCHQFDSNEYSVKTGVNNKVVLVAVGHHFSGKLLSPGKITDLQVKRDGNVWSPSGKEYIKDKSVEGGVEYEISMLGVSNKNTLLEFFSYGHIFEPNSVQIASLDDCATDLFSILAKKSHVIKGKLSPPLQGVEIKIELIGDPDSTTYVFTDEQGQYISGPFIHNSGFKVVPFFQGYTFKPDPKDEYSFLVLKLAKITVKILDNSQSPLSSVLLSISGPNSYRQNKMTDSNGEMIFGDLHPGPYYLKALLKEFQFEPSAIQIDLKEQESLEYKIIARRESFSLYGILTSYAGELMPNLLVHAKGVGNCSEYGEEGVSDDLGGFRIWALKSYCNYELTVVKSSDNSQIVERTIPEILPLKVGTEDMHNISFIIILPVRRMDISLRCNTNNPKGLDSLKALIFSSKSPEVPIHSVPFSGISYIVLPPVPKDDSEYYITFESTLNRHHYVYNLPKSINFSASRSFAHFQVEFQVEPAQIDQEVTTNSYLAFALILVVTLIIANYEKISEFLKVFYENYLSGLVQGSKRVKSKSK